MCEICGQPGFIRCNCVSAQPFCDNCSPNTNCIDIIDSQCVIYHFASLGYVPPITKLINLGLPNGSSAETIFEKIDTYFGAGFFRPWTVGNTPTLQLLLSGPGLPAVLTGNVNISAVAGNTITVNSDGLYAPGSDGKVKVDANTIPRYLVNTMVGGTDGCVSISINDIGGLLNIQPLLDMQCFTDRICGSSGNTKTQLGTCLISSALTVANTPSINLNLITVGNKLQLSANSNISSSAGNTIVINSDGLFVPTSGGTVNGANNGLSLSGTTVQLGGTLIQPTTIDFGATNQLNFINHPRLSIGSSTATPSYLNVTSVDPTINFTSRVNVTQPFSNINYLAHYSVLLLNGGPFTQTANAFQIGAGGQLNFDTSAGSFVLAGSEDHIYAGSYGVVGKIGANDVSGNIISGGHFVGVAQDSGNVSDMAAIKVRGLESFGNGIPYTGTVTNYYGLHIGDLANSINGARVTNNYAIFQAGSTSKNSFATAVVVTSDKRVKENVINFEKGLLDIEKVRIVEYNIIGDTEKRIGVIAQELEEVLPEAVQTQDRGNIKDFKVVDYNVLYSTLVNAVKELSAQNKTLNDRIFALEGKLK